MLWRTPWSEDSLSEGIPKLLGIYAAVGFTLVFLALLATLRRVWKFLKGATCVSRLHSVEYGLNELIF
jgi:hypothetical protein